MAIVHIIVVLWSSMCLMCLMQHQLDKQDLRIEMSVAALRKQAKKAAKTAADLEMTAGAANLAQCLVGSHD